MPIKQTPKTLKASSDQILDQVTRALRETSPALADRLPPESIGRLKEYGKALSTYPGGYNLFLAELVNRIGLEVFSSRAYTNPWGWAFRGVLDYGETVEEIFVNIARGYQYDPERAETTFARRHIPDVMTAFHIINHEYTYAVTIQRSDLERAFLSANGVNNLIDQIIQSLTSAANYDEFMIMKDQIVRAIQEGRTHMVNIEDFTVAENAKPISTAIKTISNQIAFMRNDGNEAGVLTFTPKDRQILIVSAAFDAIMDVEVLASAFNMDKAQFMGRRVLVDDFRGEDGNAIPGIAAVLMDEDWLMNFTKEQYMDEWRNPEGKYYTSFLQVVKLFSNSPFHNIYVFGSYDPQITAITIDPATQSIARGSRTQLVANVTATDYAMKAVTWEITGHKSSGTLITNNGLLQISKHEPVDTVITVTAKPTNNPELEATATITVIA